MNMHMRMKTVTLTFAVALFQMATSVVGGEPLHIKDKAAIAPKQELKLTFQARKLPKGETAYLFFQAYVKYAKPAGYHGRALSVSLNGKTVSGDRVVNRPRFSRMGARATETELIPIHQPFSLAFCSKVNDNAKHPDYALAGDVKSCDFEFDLTGLLKSGGLTLTGLPLPAENTLTFRSYVPPGRKSSGPIILENVEIRYRPTPASSATEAPPLLVPFLTQAPILDGRLDEPCWQNAARLTSFSSVTRKPATQPTEARLFADSGHLYLGVRCTEESMDELLMLARENDGRVWADDCIEVFIDPTAGQFHYYQMIVNAIGTVADQFSINGRYSDWAWSSEARVAGQREADSWTLEIAMPFEALGGRPAAGDVWGFNLGRERYAGEKELSSWTRLQGGFNQPRAFGRIQFGSGGDDQVGIRSLSRGWASPKGNLTQDNRFRMQLTNKGRDGKTLNIMAARKTQTVHLAAGESKTVSLAYTVPEQIGAPVIFQVEDAKKTVLYRSQTLVRPDKLPRVWHVEHPLYEELLADRPPSPQPTGAIFWSHGTRSYYMTPLALQHGFAWSGDEWMERLRRHHLYLLGNSSTMSDRTPLGKNLRKHGIQGILIGHPGSILTSHLKQAGHGDMPQSSKGHGQGVFVMDPVCFDLFVKDFEDSLRTYPKRFWGAYFADEFLETQALIGVNLFAERKRTPCPYIEQINREVREKYGFGKFGMPLSLKDRNPYRWIAYMRWINIRMAAMAAEFHSRLKAVNPEIVLISHDPLGAILPIDWSTQGKHFDIITQQLYPNRNPHNMRFAAITKLLVDLTGKPVWPCAHVEHYAANFTPAEARELISQAFRVGATGLHLYLADTAANGTGMYRRMEYYGAPRRWRSLMDIVAKTRTMNAVKRPQADCAMLFSNNAVMGIMGPDLVTGCEKTMSAYVNSVSHLAKAGVWFRFVDDEMLLHDPVLNRYKAIFVPLATYQRQAVTSKLLDYVKAGGALVVFDPKAFSNDIDGADLVKLRESLLGRAADGQTHPLGYKGAFERRVGQGRVLAFDFNPLAGKLLADTKWQAFLRRMLADLDLKLDRKIWRFQFPAPPADLMDPPPPTDVCLTGNHVVWIENEPNFLHNLDTHGVYRYSRPPDKISDEGGNAAWIAFSDGDLTDRIMAHTVTPKGGRHRPWCVSWKTSGPVDITCDFRAGQQPTRMALWWKSAAPKVTVSGSADGKTWTPLGKAAARKGKPKDILRQTVVFARDNDQKFRYLRVSFECDAEALLVEMEAWGEVMEQ